jgi:LysR family transcriptional regulator, glycine cleavage system transcriptional activator
VPAAFDRMPLGALRVFEAVATSLNFSTAADALNVSPAAVSQQIKALEDYVQVPLFRRTGRRVELTDEGLELLPAVRDGLARLTSAMHQLKHHGHAGPLQISTVVSFLQLWVLPRLRSFRRKFPDIDLRFHTSRELVDFSRSSMHVALRFGHGNYPNLYSEKLLDDWLVPVASPELIKQHGVIERGTDLSRYPLLESDDEPWSVWNKPDEEAVWSARAPNIDDSAGLLAAAEEGLGFALARWTLVTRHLQKGSLKLAGKETLPFKSSYYFVCPKSFLNLPKVAQFREWIFAAARDFPAPESARKRA